MTKPAFELEFLAPRKGKDRPFSPKARIAVKAFAQDTPDALPIVASGVSFKELDEAVDTLIQELKSIRRVAKRRFGDHKKNSAKAKKGK